MKLIFASNNKHKLEEAQAILENLVEIVSLSEIGCKEEIPETADTLEGNALQKAHYVLNKFGYPCFCR
jgi:XTP/dITP diphosphohydrolase